MPDAYPVEFDVEPQLLDRNRLTTFFRVILAIPQIIIVGSPALAVGGGVGFWGRGGGDGFRYSGGFGSSGLLGIAAGVVAIIAWFAIVFGGRMSSGLWNFLRMYMGWHAKAGAYIMLLRDEYPPFGDGEYPVRYNVAFPDTGRDRLSVGLRILYAIPHVIVLFFLNIAWTIVSIIAWFAILFTGAYPAGLYSFSVGVMRWNIRVQTYLLLMRDEYPPFSLNP